MMDNRCLCCFRGNIRSSHKRLFLFIIKHYFVFDLFGMQFTIERLIQRCFSLCSGQASVCLSQRNWWEHSRFHEERASIGTICSGIAHRVARFGQSMLYWVESLAEHDR